VLRSFVALRVSEAAKEYIETSPFAMGCLVMKGGFLQEAR
jgi:hypothetical protein